jgi:hypothetical protein
MLSATRHRHRGEICQVSIGELFFGQFVQGRLELRFDLVALVDCLEVAEFSVQFPNVLFDRHLVSSTFVKDDGCGCERSRRIKVRGTRPALPACGFCRSVRGGKTGRPRDLSRQYLVLYGTVDVEAIGKSREAQQR